jgi:hypothetical protein
MAFLLGALFNTLLISRLFWIVTKAWPISIVKAIALNVACVAVLIPIDYVVRDVRQNLPFIQELTIYGGCQMLVLIFDFVRIIIKRSIVRA